MALGKSKALFAGILLLIIIPLATVADRRCEDIADQKVDIRVIQLAFKAAILSTMSYLSYEKDPQHTLPQKVAFKTDRSAFLLRTKSLFRKTCCQIKKYLRGIWHRMVSFVRFLTAQFTANPVKSVQYEAASKGAASCPQLDDHIEQFKLRWFFGNWHEGVWHDTEVLLAESPTTAAIIFRGSDTAYDVITNSQTLEPALHSGYFGCQEGALHRGMLNAYARVDSGSLTALDSRICIQRNSDCSGNGNDIKVDLQRRPLEDTSAFQESLVGHIFNGIMCNDSSRTSLRLYNSTAMLKNILLSKLLVSAATTALNSGKKLIVAGHSLGGALATLLSLDLVVNHVTENSESALWSSSSRGGTSRKRRADTKTKSAKEKSPRTKTRSPAPNAPADFLSEWEIRANARRAWFNATSMTPTGSDVNRNATMHPHPRQLPHHHHNRHKNRHHCKPHRFYAGKRSNDTIDARLVENIYLVTFGQPDIGDEAFYLSIQESSVLAYFLLNYRYTKFVSLSKAPGCFPDIVTQLVDKVGSVLGDRLAGKRGARTIKQAMELRSKADESSNSWWRWGKSGTKNKETENVEDDDAHGKQRPPYAGKKSRTHQQPSDTSSALSTQENTTSPAGIRMHQSNHHNGTKSTGGLNCSNNGVVLVDNITRGETSSTSQPKLTEGESSRQSSRSHRTTHSLNKSSTSSSATEGRHERAAATGRDEIAEHSTDLIDFHVDVGQRLFVCSGASNDSVDAHSLRHYLHGLHFMAANYCRQRRIADPTHIVNEDTQKGSWFLRWRQQWNFWNSTKSVDLATSPGAANRTSQLAKIRRLSGGATPSDFSIDNNDNNTTISTERSTAEDIVPAASASEVDACSKINDNAIVVTCLKTTESSSSESKRLAKQRTRTTRKSPLSAASATATNGTCCSNAANNFTNISTTTTSVNDSTECLVNDAVEGSHEKETVGGLKGHQKKGKKKEKEKNNKKKKNRRNKRKTPRPKSGSYGVTLTTDLQLKAAVALGLISPSRAANLTGSGGRSIEDAVNVSKSSSSSSSSSEGDISIVEADDLFYSIVP